MTVTTDSVLSGPYYPNGAAKSFPFGFKVFDATDLRVFNRTALGDIDYDPALYSVSVGDASGSVDFTIAPAAGATLYVTLDPPFTSAIGFGIEESFLPQVHNEGFDRSSLRDQVLKDGVARGIQVPLGEVGLVLPIASARAGSLKVVTSAAEDGALGLSDGSLFKGDPGGNVAAIGLFVAASFMAIPVGADAVQTSGFSTVGVGRATYYRDAAVNAAYVAAHPRSSFLDKTGAGFRIDTARINPLQLGAAGDQASDDTAAVAEAALLVASKGIIEFTKVHFVTSTITIANLAFVTVVGPGGFAIVGNMTALSITNCDDYTVSGVKFFGSVSKQQYQVAVSGAQVAAAFDPAGWTVENLTDATVQAANVSASKAGTVVSVALTSDAGLAISRAVRSKAIALDATASYMPWIDDTFLQGNGVAMAPPLFYKADGTEFDPTVRAANAVSYVPLSGSASLTIKVGTGRGTGAATYATMSGYVGAQYDVSKISFLKLVNELAVTDFTNFPPAYLLNISGGARGLVEGCNFRQGWGAVNVIGSTSELKLIGNKGDYMFAGLSVTRCARVKVSRNILNGNFEDETGKLYPQLIQRSKGISANTGGLSRLSVTKNEICGFNWATEWGNSSAPGTLTSRVVFEGNYIEGAMAGHSSYGFDAPLFANEVIRVNYAFADRLLEVGAPNPRIINCDMEALRPYGKGCGGTGPQNYGMLIIGGRIKCHSPLTGLAAALGWDIAVKGTRLEYSNCAAYLRNVQYRFEEVEFVPFTTFIYTLSGYSVTSMLAWSSQMTLENAAADNLFKGCTITGSLYGIAYDQAHTLKLNNNLFVLPYASLRGITGPYFTASANPVDIIYTNNVGRFTGYTGALGFFGKTAAPAAGGKITVSGNKSVGLSNTLFNFTGAATLTRSGGYVDQGSTTWNPGAISAGGSATTTLPMTGVDLNCKFQVIPPYALQGCAASAFYNGTNVTIVVANPSGGSVTLASGIWRVEATYSEA